jgi:hypothetical protein
MSKLRCQWAGLVAAAGGTLWLAWVVGAGLMGRQRGPVLLGVAVATLGIVVGHYAVESFYGARMKRPGTAGAWLGALGGVVFAVGQFVRVASGGGGDAIIGIGVLTLVSGSLLVSVGLVRTRIQPPWLGVLLFVGTLAFLGFNEISPWTALGYGLAWVALGQDLYRYDPPDGRFGESTGEYGWLS